MSSEPAVQEQINQEYQTGKTLFERGSYREAVEHLLRAIALVNRNSELGGEIQIWLVVAYEAAGHSSAAIALCRELRHHSDHETRKQSRRLLYILEAPQLKRRPEWLTQIPDLGNVKDLDLSQRQGAGATPPRSSRAVAPAKPLDLSQIKTQDNGFVWVALIAIALILGGLYWFS